ncbi:hypothetical protein V2154_15870 [Ewingella sp. CoE-038-23]|uniref:hypothetical protein n=1 Tax=Ewingella docleensis TaxID=3118588 RepID=UPI00336585D1
MTETTKISVPFVVQLLKSDDSKTLMAKGEHSKEAVIAAAVEQEEIAPDDAEKYAAGKHEVNWYHTTPRDGYTAWYSPSKEGVRGSFKATVVYILW